MKQSSSILGATSVHIVGPELGLLAIIEMMDVEPLLQGCQQYMEILEKEDRNEQCIRPVAGYCNSGVINAGFSYRIFLLVAKYQMFTM